MTFNDIVRLQILNDVLHSMDEKDKRDYIAMLAQDNRQKRLEASLDAQHQKLDELIGRTSWTKSFLSDVSANVLTNAAFLILAKIIK